MRHVAEEISVILVGDLTETLIVQASAIAGDSGDDDLRLKQFRDFCTLVVIDQAGLNINLVWHGLEEDGCGGDLFG